MYQTRSYLMLIYIHYPYQIQNINIYMPYNDVRQKAETCQDKYILFALTYN